MTYCVRCRPLNYLPVPLKTKGMKNWLSFRSISFLSCAILVFLLGWVCSSLLQVFLRIPTLSTYNQGYFAQASLLKLIQISNTITTIQVFQLSLMDISSVQRGWKTHKETYTMLLTEKNRNLCIRARWDGQMCCVSPGDK